MAIKFNPFTSNFDIDNNSGGTTTPGTPVDSVQFNNPLGTFAGSAQFVYREDGSGNPFLEINIGGSQVFRIDVASGQYILGDAAGAANGNALIVDDASNQIIFNNNANNGRIDMQASTSGAGPAYFNFLADAQVPDEAYGASWDGSTEVPTKNAVYDKIQTIAGGVSASDAIAFAVAL